MEIFSKRVPKGHVHPKPHASLEEAQRGDIRIYAIYSPQNGDFFIHIVLDVPLRGTLFDDSLHHPTLHLFEVCVGFRVKVSLRDTHKSNLTRGSCFFTIAKLVEVIF